MDWLKRVSDLPLSTLIWMLPLALTLHELEEWNIMPWYQNNFVNPPQTPDHAAHTGLIFISLLGFVVTLVATRFKNPKIVGGIALTFFVPVVFANAMQHIYWLLLFDTYAPGVISALVLVIPAVIFITWKAYSNEILRYGFFVPVYTLAALSLYATIQAGDSVTPAFLKLHQFSEYLALNLGVGPY